MSRFREYRDLDVFEADAGRFGWRVRSAMVDGGAFYIASDRNGWDVARIFVHMA